MEINYKLYSGKIVFVLILLITAFIGEKAYAQREFNIWCFGLKTGIDFNGMQPKAISTSIDGFEGTSSVSDRYGNLLFYSNGFRIWNRKDNIMKNGDSLIGNNSASQAALIVPRPGNNREYFIFTVEEGRAQGMSQMKPSGIYYSIIDMNLQNGDGEVVRKNILLHTPSTERITAVRHGNETDIWIITHDWNSSAFRVYLLTHEGVSDSVISYCGDIHQVNQPEDIQGIIKASPHGNRLALSMKGQYQVFDFDNTKGIVSNPITLRPWDIINPYGIEFSPDGTKIYTTNLNYNGITSKLYQFDLNAGDAIQVNNSAVLIYERGSGRWYGALQAGPDNKIYAAKYRNDSIAVINSPNNKGLACNYNDNFIKLAGQCQLGLPGYIQTAETKIYIAGTSPVCVGDSVNLSCNSIDAIKYEWKGPKGFKTSSQNPNLYNVSADMSGTYKVTLTYKDGYVDSSSVDIEIKETIFDDIDVPQYEPLAIGGMDRQKISFKNSSLFDIYLDTVYIKMIADSVFRLFQQPKFPLLVKAGDTVTFTIDYLPLEPVTYFDSIVVLIEDPCYHRNAVGITARGLTKDLHLWLPDTNARIGQPNFCIPLKVVLECIDKIQYKSHFTAQIRYDYTAFLPDKGQPGVDFYKDGDDMVIDISGENVNFSGDTLILANICGGVYFGNLDKTPFYLTDFTWRDTLITLAKNRVHLKDGSLRINEVCVSPFRRVQSFTKSEISISPNPGSEYIDISAYCYEPGDYRVEIYNLSGILAKNLIWRAAGAQGSLEKREFRLGLEDFSAGIYIVHITTPSETAAQRLMIVK